MNKNMVMRINDHYIHINHQATLCLKRCLEQRSPRCLPLHLVIGDLDCWAPASYKVVKVKKISNITISHNRPLGLGPSILQSCKSEKKPQKLRLQQHFLLLKLPPPPQKSYKIPKEIRLFTSNCS